MSPGPLTTSTDLPPDAILVERIAALSDRAALGELDARHGMTLYAIAYTLLLDPEAADVTVATALREAWRQAASFNVRQQSVGRWLAELARRAARDRLRASLGTSPARPRTRHASAASPGLRTLVRFGYRARAALRFARVAAALVLPAILLT